MKFKYVGTKDKKHKDPEETSVYGHDFVLNGDFVEVKDKFVIEKLKGNPTFIAEGQAQEGEDDGDNGNEGGDEVSHDDKINALKLAGIKPARTKAGVEKQYAALVAEGEDDGDAE